MYSPISAAKREAAESSKINFNFPEDYHKLSITPQPHLFASNSTLNITSEVDKIMKEALSKMQELFRNTKDTVDPIINETIHNLHEDYVEREADITRHQKVVQERFDHTKNTEFRVRKTIEKTMIESFARKRRFRVFSFLKASAYETRILSKTADYLTNMRNKEKRSQVFFNWKRHVQSSIRRKKLASVSDQAASESQKTYGVEIEALKSKILEVEKELERVEANKNELGFGLSQSLLKAMSLLNTEVIGIQQEDFGDKGLKSNTVKSLEADFTNNLMLTEKSSAAFLKTTLGQSRRV